MPSNRKLAVLLIGIGIFGFLLLLGVQAWGKSAAQRRDRKRMDDLHALQQVLGLYAIDHRGFPVATTPEQISNSASFIQELRTGSTPFTTPLDPSAPTYTYTYQTDRNGTTYAIHFCLEQGVLPRYPKGCNNTLTP